MKDTQWDIGENMKRRASGQGLVSQATDVQKKPKPKTVMESRKKVSGHDFKWQDCPVCIIRGEFVSGKYILVMCGRCVMLLVPHPYAHEEEWKAITYGEGKKRKAWKVHGG